MMTTSVSDLENRRIQRIPMSLPIKVEVKIDRKMGFDEITRLKDVSAFGTGFLLSRPVKRGRLLHLTIPMPRKLRTFDFAEPQYRIWGIVRRCIKIKSANSEPEKYSIGVGFIGRTPPESYNDNPSKIYDISHREEKGFWNIFESDCKPDESHLPKDARRHTRFKIPASLLVETLDDNGNTISSEQTVTENISLSGAAIFSSFNPQIGSFVRIKSQQFNVSIISIVRGVRLANDGIKRLHIEFIDRFFPLEGIE